jgi:small subunit ribosomal protein S16
MLKIKLARFGKKNQPHYRIVVSEQRAKRDGQYKAAIGRYVPTEQPKILELDMKAYAEWLTFGAQPTPTVASLAKRFESGNPFPAKKPRPSKKAQAKAAAAKSESEKPKEEKPAQAEPAAETAPEAVAEPEAAEPAAQPDAAAPETDNSSK